MKRLLLVAVTLLLGGCVEGAYEAYCAQKSCVEQTPPLLERSTPEDGAVNVAREGPFVFQFSEPMQTTSLQLSLQPEHALGEQTWSLDDRVVTVALAEPLPKATEITLQLDAADRQNNALASTQLRFTTRPFDAPFIVSSQPAEGQSDVPPDLSVGIEFSNPMDESTVSVSVIPPVELSSPQWNEQKTFVSLAPATGFQPGTLYRVRVTGKDVGGADLTGSDSFSFLTRQPDTRAPRLIATRPSDGTTVTAPPAALQLFFDEPIDPSSLSVALQPLATLGDPVFSDDSASVSIDLPTPLEQGETYVVRVSARDLANNPLGAPDQFSFAVSAPPDTVAPTVLSIIPQDGGTQVSVDTPVIVTFSETMNGPATEGAISITNRSCQTFSWNAGLTKVTCTPDTPFAASTSYTVTVSSAAMDVAGNALVASGSRFTTSATPDTTAPTISTSVPGAGVNRVERASTIRVTFSEVMNQTATENAFAVTSPADLNGGSFSWSADGKAMTYTPPKLMPYGTTITWVVSAGAKDLAGNALAPVTRSFTTIRLVTAVIESDALLDGTLQADGSSRNVTGALNRIGDTELNDYNRTFLSFDLSGLALTLSGGAASRITSATLKIYQAALDDFSPYSGMSAQLLARSIHYGTSLNQGPNPPSLTGSDFILPVLTTTECPIACASKTMATSFTTGIVSVDFTGKVRDDWTNRSTRATRSQFRLQFNVDTDDDEKREGIEIHMGDSTAASARPTLTITYETE